MSYLATGDTGYRLTSDGKCVNAMNQAIDKSLCKPSGFMGTVFDFFSQPAPIKASDIPVPKSTVTSVKFSGSTKTPTKSWGDRLLTGLDLATKVSALNRPAAPAPSSSPGWLMPVALGGGALLLVVLLAGKK